jgi:hypothetical protein
VGEEEKMCVRLHSLFKKIRKCRLSLGTIFIRTLCLEMPVKVLQLVNVVFRANLTCSSFLWTTVTAARYCWGRLRDHDR